MDRVLVSGVLKTRFKLYQCSSGVVSTWQSYVYLSVLASLSIKWGQHGA